MHSSYFCLFFYVSLRREGYTVQVSVNDYLDIYCPHYNTSQRGTLERVVAEQYILYMVDYHGYRTCNTQKGSKRWECNRPHAPHAPIKFSEKFQRYSAFSLGYEFNVGKEYYYICESDLRTPARKTEGAAHSLFWSKIIMRSFSSAAATHTCTDGLVGVANRFWKFSWGRAVAQLQLCSLHSRLLGIVRPAEGTSLTCVVCVCSLF